MRQYPIPSVSWETKSTIVHFLWEFGTGDTACGRKIPRNAITDFTPNRAINCPVCIWQIYGIRYRELYNIRRKFENLPIIDETEIAYDVEIIGLLKARIRKHGDIAALAREIRVSRSTLSAIINGTDLVTDKVAEHFGYKRIRGFIWQEQKVLSESCESTATTNQTSTTDIPGLLE